jgi:hypothetical protein
MIAQSTWVNIFWRGIRFRINGLIFETEAEARALVEHAGKGGRLPLVLFLDGTQFFDPTLYQLG